MEVRRIPTGRGERQNGSEQAAGHTRAKQVRDGGQRTHAPLHHGPENRPPEDRACDQKTQVLKNMKRFTGERGIEEHWNVPGEHRPYPERPRDSRPRDSALDSLDPGGSQCGFGKVPGHPQQPERRNDHRQQEVLEDVRAEQVSIAKGIDRRNKIQQKEQNPAEKPEDLSNHSRPRAAEIDTSEHRAPHHHRRFPIPHHKKVHRYTTAKITIHTASTKYQYSAIDSLIAREPVPRNSAETRTTPTETCNAWTPVSVKNVAPNWLPLIVTFWRK